MNCFCGMVDQWKVFSLISNRDHCQRSSSLPVSDMSGTGFEPTQNLISGLVEWSCAVVITTTPQLHNSSKTKDDNKVFIKTNISVFKFQRPLVNFGIWNLNKNSFLKSLIKINFPEGPQGSKLARKRMKIKFFNFDENLHFPKHWVEKCEVTFKSMKLLFGNINENIPWNYLTRRIQI